MNVALVAEEAAGLQALRHIAGSGHDVRWLLSSNLRRLAAGPGIVESAQAMGIPADSATLVREAAFADQLRGRGIDVLLNVHNLRRVHPAALEAPTVGAFNLHPATLPEYAGINAVSWAVYDGADVFGSTLHWMDAEIDTGPIAYEQRFALDDDMTAGRLMSRAVREGLGLLDKLLAQLSADTGGVPRLAQDLSRRRYHGRGVPCDGEIDWAAHSARQIVRLVRACDYGPFASPWGSAHARVGDLNVEILRAAPTAATASAPAGAVSLAADGRLLIAARDEWVDVQQARVDGAIAGASDLARRLGAAAAT